jgi:hypothetical protein
MPAFYEKYGGKFLAIKNKKVLGAYDTFEKALNATLKKEKLGTFLIQECFKKEEDAMARFGRFIFTSPTI